MWQTLERLKIWSSEKQAVEEENNERALDEALAELGTDSEEEKKEEEEDDEPPHPTSSEERVIINCVGEITQVKDALVVIDGKHGWPRKNSKYDFKQGQKVEYKLVSDSKNEGRVFTVHPYEKDTWAVDDTDENTEESLTRETRGITRNVLCQVTKKSEGTLYLLSETKETFEVKLDDVDINFIAVKGDWLDCKVVAELNMDSPSLIGSILLFEKLDAHRSQVVVDGEITHWQEHWALGNINSEIFFTIEVCSPGFMPHVGDKVIAEIIESDQGGHCWRATQVMPDPSSHRDRNKEASSYANNVNRNNTLYHPKEGISVTLLTKNLSLNLGSTMNLEVEVKNSASEVHKLTAYKMRTIRNKTQISIENGPKLPLVLEPDSNFIFSLKAEARFIGKSSESLVLSFDEKFHIGCAIDLTVDDETVQTMTASATQRTSVNRTFNYDRENVVLTRNGIICPGVKPIKPPAFIPVQSGQFILPESFVKAACDPQGRPRRQSDAIDEFQKLCPVLEEPLEKKNYVEKFHTFLHLEELNIVLKMRQFYQDRAIFLPKGEFYTLEVPHLSESRPSLIIGDRVYAKNPDISATTFEGYVHKTFQNEVWLKFGPAFDDVAMGNSFEARFVHSRGVFVKCHQAIESFCRKDHLGLDWLFPSSLRNLKPPQVNFKEDCNDTCTNGQQKISEATNNDDQSPTRKNVSGRADKLFNLLDDAEMCEVNSSRSSSSSEADDHLKPPIEKGCYSASNGSEPLGDSCFAKEMNGDESRKETRTTSKPSSLDAAYRHYSNSVNIKKDAEKINWVCSGRGYGDKFKKKSNTVKSCKVLTYDKITWYNSTLNNRQKSAVKMILRGEARPLPYIIFGPPGTGKTVTMVESILQILSLIPNSRLLIATPSNSAADLITERILNSTNLLPGQLVRLVSFSYWNDGRVPPHLRPYSAIADMKEDSEKTDSTSGNGIKSCSRETLGRHRVTIGTCTSIGIMYTLGFPVGHFTHVFIDEAGQATEPESLIPLAFLHETNGQAILAGDPMQLGPVITSDLAKNYQFGISLMYRMILRVPYMPDPDRFPNTAGFDPRLVTKLLDNYRAVPELLHFTSKKFYDCLLISHVTLEYSFEDRILKKMANELPLSVKSQDRAASFVFHGVRGENYQEGDSPSWFNPQELVQVALYLKKIFDAGFEDSHVGVITPYQKQASKIREMINKMNLPMPKVGSVEEFQGQERHIIIVSVVRSREDLHDAQTERALGFLSNPFRVNVATSRARALMIIIGNPYLLGRDAYWRSAIEYAAEIGGYTGCDYPEFLIKNKENQEDLPEGNLSEQDEPN